MLPRSAAYASRLVELRGTITTGWCRDILTRTEDLSSCRELDGFSAMVSVTFWSEVLLNRAAYADI
eukprot:1713675-Rhodomonas_salina.3